MARHRPALRRLSRRGMGRAEARRPRALREARAGRIPGRAFLDHHLAQARGLPRRLRRFRCARRWRATGPRKVASLLKDEGIVRHRGKIEAAIANRREPCSRSGIGRRASASSCGASSTARRSRTLQENGRHPGRDGEHALIAKALKSHGFRFCGPTTITPSCRRRHGQRPSDRPASAMRNARSLERGSAFRAARIGAARIGALFLDLAVALSDPDRAPAADGFLQDPALGRRGLGGERLHDLTGTFMS